MTGVRASVRNDSAVQSYEAQLRLLLRSDSGITKNEVPALRKLLAKWGAYLETLQAQPSP
jgi:hypothetical protein